MPLFKFLLLGGMEIEIYIPTKLKILKYKNTQFLVLRYQCMVKCMLTRWGKKENFSIIEIDSTREEKMNHQGL